MTTEQQADCDALLRFARRCGSLTRAAYKGVRPLTVGVFIHAVLFMMPEKTDEEKQYLIHEGRKVLGTI